MIARNIAACTRRMGRNLRRWKDHPVLRDRAGDAVETLSDEWDNFIKTGFDAAGGVDGLTVYTPCQRL